MKIFNLIIIDKTANKSYVLSYPTLEKAKVAMLIDILREVNNNGYSPFKDCQWHEDHIGYNTDISSWEIQETELHN